MRAHGPRESTSLMAMKAKTIVIVVLGALGVGTLLFWQSGKGWQDERSQEIYEQHVAQVDKILRSLFRQVQDTPQPQRESFLELIQLYEGHRNSHNIPGSVNEVETVLFMKAIGNDPDQCPWIGEIRELQGRLHHMSRLRYEAFVD